MNSTENESLDSNDIPSRPTDVLAPESSKVPSVLTKKKRWPHRLLYPVKEYHQEHESATEPGGKLVCGAEMKWVGLTPLDMIQKIISSAEKSSGFCEGLRDSSLRAFLVDKENPPADVASADWRQRHEPESSDEYAGALVETYSSMELEYSFEAWDAFPATNQLLRLGTLAKDFEGIVNADPKKQWSIPSYNRVQQAFASHGDAAIATAQMSALVALVSSVEARKTNAAPLAVPPAQSSAAISLLALERSSGANPGWETRKWKRSKEKRDAFQEYMSLWLKNNFCNPFPDDEMLNKLASYLVDEVQCIALDGKASAKQLEVKGSAAFHGIMVGIAIDRVKTWLTNARGRMWRPSIAEAFDGKRPAALLLEDSIQIYAGNALRPIIGWDGSALFAFDPRYSAPVDERKRRKEIRAEGKQASGKQAKARKRSATSALGGQAAGCIADKRKMPESPPPPTLSGAKQPPALDIAPICSHVDEMLAAEGITAEDIVEV